MKKINLQKKSKPKHGSIETYWFENKNIGLKNTLFHRVTIPLEAFDSGLEYVEQPEETELVCEWYKLDLQDPKELDGLDLSFENYPDAEASIYLGSAHNWCKIEKSSLIKMKENEYSVSGSILIEFENEGVAKNELFNFETSLSFNI